MTSGRALVLVMLLMRCGAPLPPSSDAGLCVASFTPGTTDTPDGGFVAFTEGQDLGVHAGPQGGFHLFVGVETTGLPRAGKLRWAVSSQSGVELGARVLDVSTLSLEDVPCGWARRRDVLIFDNTDEVPGYRGVPARLELQVGEPDAGLRWSSTIVPR